MTDSNERVVKAGDKVRVNYIGRFENGAVFDSSGGNVPLDFTVGAEQVIQGFDQSVVGMKSGEVCKVKVSAEDGYGPHVPEMVAEVERKLIPDDDKLMIGSMLEVSVEDDNTLEVQVIEMTDTTVTLDANHPLAGKELHFEIELIEVV